MSLDEVRQLRSFNRTVTERIGALDDHYLARGRPLGASRLLWEIGPDGTDVRRLRARLALDSGYLSRLLRGLERDGLVTVGPLESDRRVRVARRTPAGDAEVAEIDRLSDDLARGLLEPLDDRQRVATASTPWPPSSDCSRPAWSRSRPPIRRATTCGSAWVRTSPSSTRGWTRASTPPSAATATSPSSSSRWGWCCWRGCAVSPSVVARCGSATAA